MSATAIDRPVIGSSAWAGCYDVGWQGEIVPEAFSHPAKVSRALVRRIYEHAFTEGWLRAGDVCCDPFGGIGGTALDALWNGVHWVGCELEPRFVGLAQQNLDLWQRKYGSKPGFGSAHILQGDSRKLASVIAGADLVCSSPPFHDSLSNKPSVQILAGSGGRMGESCKSDDVYGQSPGQLGTMREGDYAAVIASPPYAGSVHDGNGIDLSKLTGNAAGKNTQAKAEGYGREPGQLGAMKEGEAPAVIISSPPYAAIATGAGGLNTKPGKDGQQSGRSPDSASQGADQHYGESAGQLSGMPDRGFDAVVSSPPWEAGAEGNLRGRKFADPEKFAAGMIECDKVNIGSHPRTKEAALAQFKRDSKKTYGNTEGNIGNQTGDTFWQAARDIVAQCHLILRPGGHAIWITKRFIRKSKIVEFSDQWLALCRSVGFELVCRHRAMLVAHHGEQDGLFGAATTLKTERKSFFRRLAERKGSPAIDFEDVICMTKRGDHNDRRP